MTTQEWLDIEEYDEDLWDSETVLFLMEDGRELLGSYGFEEEYWEGEEEWLSGAYHDENGNTIGTPVKFKHITMEEE